MNLLIIFVGCADSQYGLPPSLLVARARAPTDRLCIALQQRERLQCRAGTGPRRDARRHARARAKAAAGRQAVHVSPSRCGPRVRGSGFSATGHSRRTASEAAESAAIERTRGSATAGGPTQPPPPLRLPSGTRFRPCGSGCSCGRWHSPDCIRGAGLHAGWRRNGRAAHPRTTRPVRRAVGAGAQCSRRCAALNIEYNVDAT